MTSYNQNMPFKIKDYQSLRQSDNAPFTPWINGSKFCSHYEVVNHNPRNKKKPPWDKQTSIRISYYGVAIISRIACGIPNLIKKKKKKGYLEVEISTHSALLLNTCIDVTPAHSQGLIQGETEGVYAPPHILRKISIIHAVF
jgi:hypothetical protein